MMTTFSSALSLKFLVMVFVILFAGIGLGPDEAQYWSWSRNLDWGYYSKPPGIAWQIFATTSFLGSTELGVRLGAAFLGTLFAIAVFALAKKCRLSDTVACMAGLLAALTPLGIFSTFLAITDGGMLLFWTLALIPLVVAIEENKPVNYPLLGLLIACGALFRWPIYLMWLVVLVLWIWRPSARSSTILLGLCISLVGLLPSLYWNIHHDFATFRHVTTIVQGGNDGGGRPNPLEFLGSQAAILSPIIFALLIGAYFRFAKVRSSAAFLGGVSLAILCSFIVYACFKKGQGNWCLFAYPSAFVFLAAVWSRFWILLGLVFSIVLTSFIFLIPTLQKQGPDAGFQIPWKVNPFRHNLGWERLGEAVAGFDPEKEFLFADKYQITSLLHFYNPLQERAYFFNLLGSRKNQFSYESPPKKGMDGIFVVVEADEKLKGLQKQYEQLLAPYFQKIHPPERVSLFEAYGKSEKGALIFKCESYSGDLPIDPEKY
jgi:hypothetical protein